MFRSKKDVDRHVKDIFIKLKNSEEQNLRCYNIAKLYYQVGDYESAKKYVSNYLEIRDKSGGAHKLLGQALEALGQKEAAFTQYKISLELEPKQDDLVLKVCELLADMDISMDVNKIKYWVERADKKFPHHATVFQLKEKMLTLEKSSGNDNDLEKLITSELSIRQTDVHLQIKLLKHYIGNHRLEDAYNHAAGIEATHTHRNNIIWYQSLSELLVKCKESKQSLSTFWIFYISVLERYAALCLKEQGNIVRKSISDATQAVFNFDQSLTEFKSKNFTNHPIFIEQMLLHMWGQLHFHLACLFLRKTKGGEDSWSEAGRLCSPLLLSALHVTPIDPTAVWTMHLNNQLKNQVHVWYREGSYRCSQAGHVLQDYARDNAKKLMDKIDKFCTSSWRERVYQRIFIGRLYQEGTQTYFGSYFVNSSFPSPPLRLCSYSELKRFDEISEEVWPDSLHHQIWVGLRTRPNNAQNEPHPNQTSRVFCELQFSVFNLNQAAPDTLSRLDIDAFLNAAILCASAILEEQHLSGFINPERLPTLPADLTSTLCTCAQEKWWSSAYKVYCTDKQKPLDDDVGEIRLELQRGLEVVRCIGNHGLHPVLLVHLARIFHYRAEKLKELDQERSEIPYLEGRSEMYWSNAIPLLERLQYNQVIRVTNSKFFHYQGKEMNNAELIKALEEGKLLLAQRFVRDKQYEKAIDALQALKCPEASFQQGQMYEILANEIVSSKLKESLTSEMRSQHIIMLSKAREYFYLTLDRLRSPGTNPKHPLNAELCTHIADIENRLKRIDPDLSRSDLSRNECDGMSDESYSSAHSGAEQPIANQTLTGLNASLNILGTPQKHAHRTPKQSSTPYKPQHQDILDLSRNRSEARPSPERLDAQIRSINQMIHSKDSMVQSITEQNKVILELNKTVLEKIEELAKEVVELRKEVQRQQQQRAQSDIVVNHNPDEALYVFGDDNYSTNQSGPASSISGNMFSSSHRHSYSQLMYPSATAFQGYYPGGMTYSDPTAQPIPPLYTPNVYPMPLLYPNARSKMPENVFQQSMFTNRFPTQMPDVMPPANQSMQFPLQTVETTKSDIIIKDAPVNKVPPVNVVITTSDTLPTTAPVVQPTFSVTIPPHFRQGSCTSAPSTVEQSVPHCYQISMPSEATIPTTVNLPPLETTLTTTTANISMAESAKDTPNVYPTGSSDASDQEHDPIPDFVPSIPLPAEIKVTTGEEGLETLFCARAKLFRYVDNEWKERGVGNVKLLRNEEGKVRLLMRREQVLKVCANHYLAPDMELNVMANNQQTWFWAAHDFADGELRFEKFCIKFKTVDEGLSFKEQFDKAKASLVQSPEKLDPGKASKTDVGSTRTKKEAKPTGQKQLEVTASSETASQNTPPTVVGGFSFSSTPIIQKPATVEPKEPASKPEEVGPFAGFTFNKTESSAATQANVIPTTSQTFTFSFGKAATAMETATVPTIVTTHTTPISSSQPSTVAAGETVSSSTVQYSLRRPHAPPPSASATVGVQGTDTTPGEHEETLFGDKISLQYRNSNTKQWENRGTGQMKTLWNSKTGRVRLLMVEEGSSRVCYNYNVLAKTQFTFKGSTVVKWTIQYGPENKIGKFAATFKSFAQAYQFYNTVVNNQRKMVKDCISVESMKEQGTPSVQTKKAQPSLAEMFKPADGSWECSTCYTRNGESHAKCLACKAPGPSAASKPSAAAVTATNEIPLSEMFKTPPGSWKCNCCYIVNTSGNNYCVACDSPKDPSMPPKQKTDGFNLGTSSPGDTPTFTFGIPQYTAKNSPSGFSFRFPASNSADSTAATAAPEADAKTNTSTGKFVFGMPQRPITPPNKDSPFTFGSPGKSFGFNFVAKSPEKSPGGENSEEEEEESDDIQFSPIIPLPDKIEVKTGEENEEVLYSHRAKLFRFDKTNVNEWKERGLGDIKLLRHRETGKLRLIMRREQILKLCLNHFVLPNLELQPMGEKTWLWNAADYSEGEIEHMSFACRFKSAEIAMDFKNVLDRARKGEKLPAIEQKTETNDDTTKVSPTRDIEVLYEMKVTPEEKEAALKLQLPENFYAYKQKADCPGCRGCREPGLPLFKDDGSEKPASELKTSAAIPAVQFPSKTTSFSTTASEVVPSVQSSVLSTGMQNSPSSIFKPAECATTAAAQFPTNSLFTTAVSTLPFGSTGTNIIASSNTPNDKKASFSFVIPQTQPSATEDDKQNALVSKNLNICSPTSSQAQVTTAASSPFGVTSLSTTPSIFGGMVGKSDNSFSFSPGKNMFGGTSQKESTALIKPSSFSMGTKESNFTNTFNAPAKTTASATTAASIFGTGGPLVFGSSAMKTGTETTAAASSPFMTNSATFGLSTKSTNSVFPSASTSFSFDTCFGTPTNPSLYGITNSTTGSMFGTTTPSENEPEKESTIHFLPTTDVSFSTLAANASQQAFKIDPNFSFAGAGSAVFGSKSTDGNMGALDTSRTSEGKKDENAEDEGDENEQEHDPHFEPIVPLPDVVEVRTGEEDEEKVFCERAKLYRYSDDTCEWKERGVGDMKILHHVEHGIYRLLLRREKVHKVVCNLLLTPEISFGRLLTCERTWVWACMNYAEETPAVERLAVKFKSSDVATKFKDTVDKIQQTLIDTRKKSAEDGSLTEKPDEEKNEDTDEEEEEDEDQNSIIFEKRATLLSRTAKETKWTSVALGNLIIYYDSHIFGEKIILKVDETGEVVSNTIISMNTQMQVDGKECIWTAIDYALTPAARRTLRAVFSSVQAAQQMYKHFQEGVECAKQADISEPFYEE